MFSMESVTFQFECGCFLLLYVKDRNCRFLGAIDFCPEHKGAERLEDILPRALTRIFYQPKNAELEELKVPEFEEMGTI